MSLEAYQSTGRPFCYCCVCEAVLNYTRVYCKPISIDKIRYLPGISAAVRDVLSRQGDRALPYVHNTCYKRVLACQSTATRSVPNAKEKARRLSFAVDHCPSKRQRPADLTEDALEDALEDEVVVGDAKVVLGGKVVLVADARRRVPLPQADGPGGRMPLAEGESSLGCKSGWQPLSPAMVPHAPGVYWLGLEQGGKVVPLYHGQASHLDERVADHRRALEGRGPDTPGVYWGLFLAAQVGTVVVGWEETAAPKEAEARELSRRNYAFNCNANGGYRIKAGLQAVGISPAEVQEVWAKLAKL